MAYDPCADPDQLELHTAERSGFLPRDGEASEIIYQVLGEDEKSQPPLVGDKARARNASGKEHSLPP